MNEHRNHSPVILVAEDDDDHYLLVCSAFREAHPHKELHRVTNGEELMRYLLRQDPYKNLRASPLPLMIVLDLNMPKKDGRAALKELKSYPELSQIPIVVLTTLSNEEDQTLSYELGVKLFIKKPISFKEYVQTIKTLDQYWS